MLNTRPLGRRHVYVCTNISCSLCGANELRARLQELLGDEPDVSLRSFECLGACDIAPMVSVDGVYVGPVEEQDIPALVEQIRTGAEPLPGKQLVKRRVADPDANSQDWGELGPVVHS
jgi:NADH-quinone oxidoreductase subunit E